MRVSRSMNRVKRKKEVMGREGAISIQTCTTNGRMEMGGWSDHSSPLSTTTLLL